MTPKCFFGILNLILSCSGMNVERGANGDLVNGESSCAEGTTNFFNSDETLSTLCAKTMKDAGCDMVFGREPFDKVGFVGKGNRETIFDVVSTCDARTVYSKMLLQDYKYNANQPLWTDQFGMETMKNITKVEVNDGTIEVNFTGHCPGVLVKILFKCLDENGLENMTDADKRCVYVKFEGTMTYPLSAEDFVKFPTTIKPNATSSATLKTVTEKTTTTIVTESVTTTASSTTDDTPSDTAAVVMTTQRTTISTPIITPAKLEDRKYETAILIGVLVALAVIIWIIIVVCLVVRKRREKKLQEKVDRSLDQAMKNPMSFGDRKPSQVVNHNENFKRYDYDIYDAVQRSNPGFDYADENYDGGDDDGGDGDDDGSDDDSYLDPVEGEDELAAPDSSQEINKSPATNRVTIFIGPKGVEYAKITKVTKEPAPKVINFENDEIIF